MGTGSADMAVGHIRRVHPERYENGDWQILPIRDYAKKK